jgi:Prokaryotic glutathione synthetase, ATP-grasp domain
VAGGARSPYLSALADAEYKPRQLVLLRQAGLVTPPTLVTNDPAAVRAFAAAQGDLVVKPLTEPIVWEGGGESVVFTRRVAAGDLDTLDGVDTTAHLFQSTSAPASPATCGPRRWRTRRSTS